VNVRGELLIRVELRHLLGVAAPEVPTEHGKHGRLIVLSSERGRIAVAVDEISGVIRYSRKQLRDIPNTLAYASAVYVSSILPQDGRMIACLHPDLLAHVLEQSLS
jgi:chemotaxis signal transduction protein